MQRVRGVSRVLFVASVAVALAGCGPSGGGGSSGSSVAGVMSGSRYGGGNGVGGVGSGSGTGSGSQPTGPYSGAPLAGSTNAFDVAALQALQAANVEPVGLSSDQEFLRRVTADLAGRIPTTAETSAFVADTSPDKRAKTIDTLLSSTDYANHWGKDILGEWACVTTKNTAYDDGLVADVQNDVSMKDFATRIATGTQIEGIAFDNQFKGNGGNDAVDHIMLMFTGMTSQCARCHDHHLAVAGQDDPMWTQDDNYGLYAFLAKNNGAATKLDITGKRMGQPVEPHWIVDGYASQIKVGDPSLPKLADPIATRRAKFADLLVSSKAFARGLGHRIFAEVMDPILDPNQFLAANLQGVKNPALLDAVAATFTAQQFSLRGFLREVLNSKLYQLTTAGTDTTNDPLFARRTVRRHHSEVIDKAVSAVAGATWKPTDGFLMTVFGYPQKRATIQDRNDNANLAQTLVLMNSPEMTNGRIAQSNSQTQSLAAQVDGKTITIDQAITTLFQSALNRDPSSDELTKLKPIIAQAAKTQDGLDDLAVAICSTSEFVSR